MAEEQRAYDAQGKNLDRWARDYFDKKASGGAAENSAGGHVTNSSTEDHVHHEW